MQKLNYTVKNVCVFLEDLLNAKLPRKGTSQLSHFTCILLVVVKTYFFFEYTQINAV